jgi:hypothetical protein
VLIERSYNTFIYLSFSFSIIRKWHTSTTNIGWYLLATKKKFIFTIISETCIKKRKVQKHETTPSSKECMSILTFDQNAFTNKEGWMFFQRSALACFYENIIREWRSLIMKNMPDLRFGLIYLYFDKLYTGHWLLIHFHVYDNIREKILIKLFILMAFFLSSRLMHDRSYWKMNSFYLSEHQTVDKSSDIYMVLKNKMHTLLTCTTNSIPENWIIVFL